MNFKNLVLATLTFGVIFSVSTKNSVVVGETTNNLKSNYQKPLSAQQNFNYKKAIAHKLNGGRITTQFTPRDNNGDNISLSNLAESLGYDHFNWVSYVEADPYGINDRDGNMMSTPYNDPPMGGYQYDSADRLPFYWDVVSCDLCKQRHHIQHSKNLQQYKLTFKDAPTDSRLQPGEAIEFMTSLVGVKGVNADKQSAQWDVLHTFRWKTTNTDAGFQVSIVDTNINTTQIPDLLLSQMVLDGAELSTSVKDVANLKYETEN